MQGGFGGISIDDAWLIYWHGEKETYNIIIIIHLFIYFGMTPYFSDPRRKISKENEI